MSSGLDPADLITSMAGALQRAQPRCHTGSLHWWLLCSKTGHHDRSLATTSGVRRASDSSSDSDIGNVVSRGYRGTDPDTGEILPYLHADHSHADTGCPVSFSTGKESNQLFARDCIRAFTLDTTTGYLSTSATNPNQWTTAHQASLDALLASLSMDCFDIDTNISEYLIFLDYIMMHAFADRAAGHFRWSGAQDL